jgi:large subunit ribosomal protein L24
MERIKKGDTVEVIAGSERGARGEVHEVRPKQDRVVIHGVKMVKKHQRRTGNVRTQTGIIEIEAPIHLSNVMPVCKVCDAPVRVAFRVDPDGTKQRACRKCGGLLDG